jgi:hypothetical protein
MGDFAQMHIFFAVTTGAVVVVALLVAAALYYLVSILRTIDRLSKAALEEGELIREDIADLRLSVRHEGAKLKAFTKFGKKFAERFTPGDDSKND